jgi:1,2-diacylglycerol 3-beta-glucosyltransferase
MSASAPDGSAASAALFPERPGTPLGWRLVAVGVMGGSLAAGVAAARAVPIAGLLSLAGLMAAAYVGRIAVASRRPPLEPGPPPAGTELPHVTVIVAARDEAGVLPQLVADLAGQDHRDDAGRPRFELIVVDDRSVDGTAQAVLDAAALGGLTEVTRVIRRGPQVGEGSAVEPFGEASADALPDGKGAALTAAPPAICRGEVIAVLDADARIAPDFLRVVAGYFARGAEAMTARRRVMPGGQGFWGQLAGAQDDEQTADGELQRGRWALGGCSEFRGNGILVSRERLAEVGGWRAEALCEDLDLSTRLAAALGIRVGWAIDAVVWEEPVLGWRALWRQRGRWAEGIVRRQLDLTLPLLRSRRLRLAAKLDYLGYSAQTVIPLAMLGTVVGALAFGDWRPALGFGGIYLAAGTLLAADSLRWTTDEGGHPLGLILRVLRGLRAALFSSHWLAVFPIGWGRVAFGRGAVRYVKMVHTGAPTGWRPTQTPGSGDGAS